MSDKLKAVVEAAGECECGCGQETTIAVKTSKRENIKKGEYRRFAFGHQNRRNIKNHKNEPKEGQFYHSGYVYVKAPDDHPRPTANRYIKRCRLVAEKNIGRYLEDGEVVHHINEKRDDDRPENLQVMTRGEHNSLHKAIRR
jgi:hypothetical protein